MKKKFLSAVLAFSLTISLFTAPVSAASSGIGVTTQLDTESVNAWTNYFKTHATNSELIQFLADSLGISATRSVVCWKLVDYVVNTYGLGEQSLSRLTSICSSYSHAFYNESITTVKSVFDFLLASGTGRWQLAKFWQLMFGVVPEFVIDDQWGTSGIYRIKEVNSGLYVCSSTGRYAYADYGATVVSSDSSDKSGYQWIGDRTAGELAKTGKVQIILEHNLQLLQDQLRREGTGTFIGNLGMEYKCIKNGKRQVLANANGDSIVYRTYKNPYIINEEPRVPVEEDESSIITDPSYFVDKDGQMYSVESLIYDNSTHTYTTNTYTYNIDNSTYEYKTWNIDYYINYTYVYNIGQSEVLEEYTQYYKLPDGRSSADLTKEELEQLNLNIDVTNYQLVNDASSLIGLWHLDGNLMDSGFYGSAATMTVPSITYLDSGAFNGALYIPHTLSSNAVDVPVLTFPVYDSGFSPTQDWTIEFRFKIEAQGNLENCIASFCLFGGTQDLYITDGVLFLNANGSLYECGNVAYGVWNHIAAVYHDGLIYIYLNGYCNSFSIGRSFTPFSYFFQMCFSTSDAAFAVDEVRISGEALYSSAFIVPSVPFDSNLVLVLPDVDGDSETTTLSSVGQAFPVETLSGSPAYESLSAISSEAVVTRNAVDNELAVAPLSASSSGFRHQICIENLSSYGDAELPLVLDIIPFNDCASFVSSPAGLYGDFYFVDAQRVRYSFSSNGISCGGRATLDFLAPASGTYFLETCVGLVPVKRELSPSWYITEDVVDHTTYVTIRDKQPYGGIIVKCVNSGGNASDVFSYTVTLGDSSISGTYGDMYFSSGVASFTLMGGQQKEASALPAGTRYLVVQADKDGYSTTSNFYRDGDIAAESTYVVPFTNTFTSSSAASTGSLSISNTVSSGETADTFTYTVTLGDTSYSDNGFTNGVKTLTLSAGGSVTLAGLPLTTYIVEQAENSHYTVTSYGASGLISADTVAAATFTNTSISVSPQETLKVEHPVLAVKTQIPVSDYQIGGVRPTYPSIGLVWAMVEKGYITSIQIYTGYAWEAVDARIWTGSRWIPYNYFNVITLNDMYDIVDASGNQGYEYIYTDSGFWNWWQRAWTDFVKFFQNIEFGGGGSSTGSSGGVSEGTESNINSGEYASGEDISVVEAISDSGKGLWSILKDILGIVGNVFSEAGTIGNAFHGAFDDSGGEDSAFYIIFDVPLEPMSPTG